MAGPELILTTVNCFLEQAKPEEWRSRHRVRSARSAGTTQTPGAGEKRGAFKSHDLSADWVTRKWGLGGARAAQWQLQAATEETSRAARGTRLEKSQSPTVSHGESHRATYCTGSWPIWETALAKITSPLVSLAGAGRNRQRLKGDRGGKEQLHIKKGEGNQNSEHVQCHMRVFPRNPSATAPWERARGSVTALEQWHGREKEGFVDAWTTGWTHGWGTSPKLLEELLPILSIYVHPHIPLSQGPGPQGFPRVRSQPRAERAEAEPAAQGEVLILKDAATRRPGEQQRTKGKEKGF